MLLFNTPAVETPRLTTWPATMRLTYRHGVCPPPFVTENTAPVTSSSVPFLQRKRSPGCGVIFGSRANVIFRPRFGYSRSNTNKSRLKVNRIAPTGSFRNGR
jgi:hypothetical protein